MESTSSYHPEFDIHEHQNRVPSCFSKPGRVTGLDLVFYYIEKIYQVGFKRISLIGFRSCTSRSYYRSVSKQTTRISQVTYRRACLMLALKGFPSSL
ncbi:hypothetical protein Tco_0505884 [Tanacetum coccineum]